MSRGHPRKVWTASDTAEMAVLRGRGKSTAYIAKKLGFSPFTVSRKAAAFGTACIRHNYWTAPLRRYQASMAS